MRRLTKQGDIEVRDFLALRSLCQRLSGCQECQLCEHRQSPVLLRQESGPSPLLVIGEAPGEEEDKTGLPFIGKCGHLVEDRLFENSYFPHVITNAVCCRPPGNRTPYDHEVQACSFHLKELFEIYRPQFILLLGATAAFALYNLLEDLDPSVDPVGLLGRMNKTRGVLRHCDIDGVGQLTWMKTWHPGYVLRNRTGDVMEEFETDISTIVKYREDHHA